MPRSRALCLDSADSPALAEKSGANAAHKVRSATILILRSDFILRPQMRDDNLNSRMLCLDGGGKR